jgi:hypothetical protein
MMRSVYHFWPLLYPSVSVIVKKHGNYKQSMAKVAKSEMSRDIITLESAFIQFVLLLIYFPEIFHAIFFTKIHRIM